MKKILAILLVLSVVFAFAACSSKEYEEVVVTVPVTDESGEPVTKDDGTVVTEAATDESGKHLTEVVKPSTEKLSSTHDSTPKDDKKTTDKKSKTTAEKSSNKEKTSAAQKPSSSKNNSTTQNETSASQTTTKKNSDTAKQTTKPTEKDTTKESATESTTEKPKKRDVTVDILIPNINLDEAELRVKYAYKKDNGETVTKYYEFDDPDKTFGKLDYKAVTMDGKTVVTCVLKNIKGNVTVRCELSDVELSDNVVKIGAYEDKGSIKPYSGIENMIAEDL